MGKVIAFLILFVLYSAYSMLVYTKGTESPVAFAGRQQSIINEGKAIYEAYNCNACHQIYGLGGYLGPDLTTAWSDPNRGDAYMRALLKSGSSRMPDFKFSKTQVDALMQYLAYVDSTATSYK